MKKMRPFTLALLTVALGVAGVGCGEGSPNTERSEAPAAAEGTITVTPEDINALPSGQSYVVDLSKNSVTYTVDLSAGDIDLNRIALVLKSGERVSLRDWLAKKSEVGQGASQENASSLVLTSSNEYASSLLSTREGSNVRPQLTQGGDTTIIILDDGTVIIIKR